MRHSYLKQTNTFTNFGLLIYIQQTNTFTNTEPLIQQTYTLTNYELLMYPVGETV